MMKRLITSALPYVNNIPHLGNLIQVLSADVFARYCRLKGVPTFYVCGTDEYGTATETKALEEGVSPRELCDRYHKLHAEIYSWFNIAFDKFGRTSTPYHTEITQDIFLKLDKAGYITEKTIQQLYCEQDKMFLADRYVRGTCPFCGYTEARGDQCENCGKLLDPTDLKDPYCGTCKSTPVLKETRHLYINLPAILPKLQEWMKEASVQGFWARNAIQMTQAWIRDGLHERAITRDLKWGVPVPKPGFENKVFYVWFDAPIGYISITASHTDEWASWWKNPEDVNLFQFIGKDNIPFHTVIFPSSLLGSGDNWTLLYHMSSTEYLNYESGKFSKSKGVGVFGNDVMSTGIPADVWRFYIYYNRPEKSDSVFVWKDFQEKVNSELIGNLSNLVNRTLTFIDKNFKGGVPEGGSDTGFWEAASRLEQEVSDALERVELRDAFHKIFALSSLGNKRFQDKEPWKLIKDKPAQAAGLLKDLVYLIRDLSILMAPYLPVTAARIQDFLNLDPQACGWDTLGRLTGIKELKRPELLFKRLEDKDIEAFSLRFSGTQQERAAQPQPQPQSAKPQPAPGAPEQPVEQPVDPAVLTGKFRQNIELRVGKIEKIERHPKADKLYVETISFGPKKEATGEQTGEQVEMRQIVSGLVPYYREEELLGKKIVLAYNLKPARLRGVDSQGMLLAAEKEGTVEVVFVEHAHPGDRIILEGAAMSDSEVTAHAPEITIDEFFNIPIRVADYTLQVGGKALTVAGQPVKVKKVDSGKVQ